MPDPNTHKKTLERQLATTSNEIANVVEAYYKTGIVNNVKIEKLLADCLSLNQKIASLNGPALSLEEKIEVIVLLARLYWRHATLALLFPDKTILETAEKNLREIAHNPLTRERTAVEKQLFEEYKAKLNRL